MSEIWRDIDGRQFYEVSNLGNVRSLDRIQLTKRGSRRYKGHHLQKSLATLGYLVVSIDGARKRGVHRLVAEAFLGPPHGKMVNHKDGNKTNNHVDNLEWVTARENIIHAFKTGLSGRVRGEESPMAKLTEDAVRDIRQMLLAGELSQAEIGSLFGVSRGPVHAIHRGIAWKHIA